MGLVAIFRRWIGRAGCSESLGRRGERAAARFLRRLGYKIIATGQRNALGEIDLVAIDGDAIVFVEVKTRASHDKGHPADAVHENKQRQLSRLATAYLKRRGMLEQRARFDIVAVTWPVGRKQPDIEHLKNAFEPSGRGQMFS